ncbi:hypothetical protein A3K86_15150 [Photobacterium jeanii]|uniref:diguanylate cyclase n=1 Tax=Photobacterium jeanii TaxID=858640 RepID=A0A178K8D1_9GAMM|nr:sensor domain-containing diguanylate cyclase [Photobacterium jeanii]OAN13004.1 hypothetical protein A3K86_15150 [Photobacterium jeanii]PST89152.1 sensor domain-containing diguanylate cyclase [Photobacterium jeanii]
MIKARILSQILTMLTRLQQEQGRDAVKQVRKKIELMIKEADITLPEEYVSFLNAYDVYRCRPIEEAIPHFIHCQMLCENNQNTVLYIYCDLHLGTIYSLIGQFHQSLKHFLAALSNNSIEDDNLKLLLNLNISDAYISLGDFSRVKSYSLKAIGLAELLNDKSCLTLALDNAAIAEGYIGNFIAANFYIERSITIAHELACPRSLGFAVGYKARIEAMQNNDEEAKLLFEQADAHFKASYEYYGRGDCLCYFAALLFKLNDYELALQHVHQALALIKAEKNYQLRIRLFELEAKIYKRQGKLLLENLAIEKQAKLSAEELKRATHSETLYIESILQLGEQKREHDTLQQLHSKLKIITEIGQNIATITNLNDCLLDVSQQVNKIIPIHVFGIALFDEENKVLNYNHFIEDETLIAPFTINCEHISSLGAYCIYHQQTLLLNTSSLDEVTGYIDPKYLDRQMYFGDGEQNQSGIITPIKLNNKTIGALFLEHRTAFLYQSYHCELAEQLASFIAVALENQRQTQALHQQQLALATINQKLDMLSRQDPLTQLYNRYELEKVVPEVIANAVEKNEPLTCLMIDVDYYKGFNDFYGHHKGDQVLVTLAKTFQQVFNAPNDYVFRYGGDEFLMLLAGQTLQQAKEKVAIVEKAVADLAISHSQSACSSVLTLSIGGYCCHDLYNMGLNRLIQKTDKALYQAKSRGRNTFVGYEEQQAVKKNTMQHKQVDEQAKISDRC